MRVIIAGGRNVTDFTYVKQAVEKSEFNITQVVSGGARGADKLGEAWANQNHKKVIKFNAPWNDIKNKPSNEIGTTKQGKFYWKKAGYFRNGQMEEYSDALIAIWDGKSKGTKDMIDRVVAAKKPVYVYYI